MASPSARRRPRASRIVRPMVVLVGLLLMPGAAAAQELGLKAGLTLANVNISEPGRLPRELQWCCSPWDGTRHDLASGVFAGWNLRPGVAVQTEVLLVRRGFEIGASGAGPGARLRMSYIEAPILLQYVGGLVRIHTGPAIGLAVGSRSWSDEVSLAKLDVSLGIGASLHRGRFSLDGRYAHGLRNVLRHAPANAGLRHKSLMLLAGVRLAGPGCASEVPRKPPAPWRR
jgi:hypothetical protein